jgi:hypothetical protein
MAEEIQKEKSVRGEDGIWTIVARAPKVDREMKVRVNLHDGNTGDMIAWTSEDCVRDNCRANWIIGLQSGLRRLLEGQKSAEEVQKFADEWKPDVVTRTAADPIAATLNKFSNMDAEAQKEFMAALKQRLAKKG